MLVSLTYIHYMLVLLTLSSIANKKKYNGSMIGKKLKSLRNENAITQAELAKALNVTRSAVALWETDKTDPDISNLITIAKYFSITVDELLGVEDITYYSSSEIVHNDFRNNKGTINQTIKK